MIRSGLRAQPSLAVLYAGLLLVVVIAGVATGPVPDWWAIYLPEPSAAAFRLREAQFVALDTSCRWQDVEDWRRIRTHPSAESYFGALVDGSGSGASVIYGLAGLREVDSHSFAARLRGLGPAFVHDSVVVVDTDERGPVPVTSLLARLESGKLAQLFRQGDQRPEC